ncbi:DUF2798 domain-containing protein [Flavobacteriaceae bacterium R38]|nr:DUF2798 domain-containing protein [Flavobacteriaceae bacterium R38]
MKKQKLKLQAENENLKKFIFAFLMGLVTTCIISFSIVAINIGFNERFIKIWFKSWGLAYILVIPAILFIAPLIDMLIDYIFKRKKVNVKR